MNLFLKFIKKYSYLLGIFIFVVILLRINFDIFWQTIKTVKFSYLIIAALLAFPMMLVKTWCWNYIKNQQEIKYGLKDSFLMYGSGLYAASFTPGKIGEMVKALYLKKDGYSLGKSLVSVVLDRLSDFVFLILFIFFGSLFFITIFQKQISILIFGLMAFVLMLIIFIKTGLLKFALKKLFSILVSQKHQKSWKINFQDFINDIKIYKFKNYLIVLLITTFSWLFYYIQMYVLAQGANIANNIPFLYLAISVTIAGLIALIPISISGIGTRDAALILLFAPFMIAKEQAIIFSALILSMYLFTTLIGLICWLIKPIKF